LLENKKVTSCTALGESAVSERKNPVRAVEGVGMLSCGMVHRAKVSIRKAGQRGKRFPPACQAGV
jgi:hypothetical protein